MFIPELTELARRIGAQLRTRGETVAVAEGSAGGLISAALLSVPGASAYYLGGAVVYTAAASRTWMAGAVEVPAGMRGATEAFAGYLAQSVALRVGATWGIGEAGAAGPANPYGDPAGHCWVAAAGPGSGPAASPVTTTRHILTGLDDRGENMVAFATAALALFEDVLSGAATAPRVNSTQSAYEDAHVRAVRPYLIVGDAEGAIDFYRRALNARELERHTSPAGRIAHAKLRIGETIVELGEHPDAAGREREALPRVGLRHYVADVDETYARAIEAGATAGDPPSNRLPGVRAAGIHDPYGITWWLAAVVG